MLGKKLLTLVCAIGILICGACFGPLYRAPAPPRLNLHGVHSVRVEVKNVSGSEHYDPDELASAIANSINMQTRAQLGAEASSESLPEQDAVMKVNVLSDLPVAQGQLDARGFQRWTINFQLSATLSWRDGSLIWQHEDQNFPISLTVPEQSPPDVWSQKGAVDVVLRILANRFVSRLPHTP